MCIKVLKLLDLDLFFRVKLKNEPAATFPVRARHSCVQCIDRLVRIALLMCVDVSCLSGSRILFPVKRRRVYSAYAFL